MSTSNCCADGVSFPGVKIGATAQGSVCVPQRPRDLEGNGLFVSLFVFDSTQGQDVFAGSDRNGNVLNAVPDQTLVMVNGVSLDPTDYVLTSTTLTLNEPSEYGNDNVSMIVFREPDTSAFEALEARVAALENAQ